MEESTSRDPSPGDRPGALAWPVRYGIALAFAAIALALTVLLERFLQSQVYLFFFAAVAFSAWLAGFGPTIIVSVVGLATVEYLFFEPVGRFGQPRAWDFVSLALFLSIAGLINLIAARQRRATARAQARAREERALRRAAAAITAAGTVDQIVAEIARSALDATDADSALIERLSPGGDLVDVVAAAGAGSLPVGARVPYPGSLAERVLDARAPFGFDLLADDPRAPEHLRHACERCSALAVPMVADGQAIGALILLRAAGRAPFASAEVERAVVFADLASVAFNRVRLLEASEASRRELERVLDAQAHLIRGFSHDVKNPLGAADGQLALVDEGVFGPLADRQREGVDRSRRLIATALRLIDALVDFARARSGSVPLRPVSTDVAALARTVVEDHRPAADAQGLTLEATLSEPEALVIATDPDRVGQILANMLSNAIKYTPEGGRVEVRVRSAKPRGGAGAKGSGSGAGPGAARAGVAVSVSDTGPGIPEAKREAVFEEFTRLEAGGEPGAGLGLAISRRLARLLGGDLTLESEVGRGSTFTLGLPAEPPVEAADGVRPEAGIGAAATRDMTE